MSLNEDVDELKKIHSHNGWCEQHQDKLQQLYFELDKKLTKYVAYLTILAVIFSILGPIIAQNIIAKLDIPSSQKVSLDKKKDG